MLELVLVGSFVELIKCRMMKTREKLEMHSHLERCVLCDMGGLGWDTQNTDPWIFYLLLVPVLIHGR